MTEVKVPAKRRGARSGLGGTRSTWGVALAVVGVGEMVGLFYAFRTHLSGWLSPQYLSSLNDWQSIVFAVCLGVVASTSLWLLYQILKAAERLTLPESWVVLVLTRNAGFLRALLGLPARDAAVVESSVERPLETAVDLGTDERPQSAEPIAHFGLRSTLGIVCYALVTPAPLVLLWFSFSGIDSVSMQVDVKRVNLVAAMLGHVAIHGAAVWFLAQLLKVGERFALPSAWVQQGIVREPDLLRALLGVQDLTVGVKEVAADTQEVLKPIETVKSVMRD